jgi:hypothetical protein
VSEIERPSREIERARRREVAPRRDAELRHDLVPRPDVGARYQPAVGQYAGGRGGDDRYSGDPHGEDSYGHDQFAGGRDRHPDDEPDTDWSRQLAALRRHRVTLACLALILGSLIWKAGFLSRYFYRQDDFWIFDTALRSGLNWGLIGRTWGAGQFIPGPAALSWVLARVALYSWAAGAGVEFVMIAGAGLAAWRLLRTLLGNRPAILIPLVLYLVCPLTFPDYSWWIAGVETVPLQIAIFMSLTAHVHYVWTGRYRHALAAAGWLVFGLIFFEKAAVIPLLLFAVTAGFLLGRRRLLPAVRQSVVQFWRAWLLYLGLLAFYGVLLGLALRSSTVRPGAPSSASAVGTFSWELVHRTLLPGLLGGPWHWFHTVNSAYAFSSPPSWLAWASLLAVLGIIAATILTRRRAWRAWAILAIWVVLADMVPVIIGRLQVPGVAGLFAMETRYVADAAAVLAVVIGLACWPLASPAEEGASAPRQRREFFTGRWKPVALGLVAVIAASSVWSVQKFASVTSGTVSRTYIANARSALALVPSGSVILDRQVPPGVMLGIYHHDSFASVVLRPMSHRGAQITWTVQPVGNIGRLKLFGPDGRLYPAAIAGTSSGAFSGARSCVTAKRTRLVIPFPSPSVSYARVLRIDYRASPAIAGESVTVTYGGITGQLVLRSGLNNAYFTVSGSAADVAVQAQTGAGLCVYDAVAGYFVPAFGGAIPPVPSS